MPLTAKTQLPKEHHILIYEVQSHHEVLLDVLELKFSLNRNSLLNFQKKYGSLIISSYWICPIAYGLKIKPKESHNPVNLIILLRRGGAE